MSRKVIKRARGNSRIIFCIDGSNTYEKTHMDKTDKTLLKWMEYLGHEAHQHNTIVHVLYTAGIFPI